MVYLTRKLFFSLNLMFPTVHVLFQDVFQATTQKHQLVALKKVSSNERLLHDSQSPVESISL